MWCGALLAKLNCLAGELFSTVVSVDTVLVTVPNNERNINFILQSTCTGESTTFLISIVLVAVVN